MELDKVLTRQAKRLRDDVARKDSGERLLKHVPTGFRAIDDEYGGVRRGVATALVAHTGVGKSSFARQVCEGAARAGAGVLWVIGEDPEDATAERYLADGTGVTATEMGRLDLTAGELDRIAQAAAEAGSWAKRVRPVFECPTVDEVLQLVDDTADVGGAPLAFVVLDYAQIFGDSDNLEREIATLGRGMQERAGSRNIATLILSQASNDCLKRGRDEYFRSKDVKGFLPGKGDIEWCKRLEKSTKAYWVLDRPGLWRREMGEDDPDDTAELHVKKANFGPTGWVPLAWDGPKCRFSDKD
jgi:replicative DNA helicase